MATVSTYLNFPGNTEEAFNFYKSVFGGEFTGGGVARFGDLPPAEGAPSLAEENENLIMHIELALPGGHLLMGTDAPESMGFHVNFGNNVYIMIDPDSRQEAKRLFDALSDGGTIEMGMNDTFWGAYYGSCTDKFGVHWMFNCTAKNIFEMPDTKTNITVQAVIHAPIDDVWKKWTSPEHIVKWNNASEDWHTPWAKNDLRAGGSFVSRMEARDGSFGFDFEGIYDEVVTASLIVYHIADGRKVTVAFTHENGKTIVTETFESETVNSPELQQQGWQSILNNFKKYCEQFT